MTDYQFSILLLC